MADINASTPVTAPAVGSVVYDKWIVTKLVANIGLEKSPMLVNLHRAAKTADGWKLMPDTDNGDESVSFNLDVYKEAANTPEIGAAIEAITAAVVAYGTKKKLI